MIKYFEYSHKFHEGLLPGKYYSHQGDTVPGQFMFFSFYFMMTGLHGFHVLVGMGAMVWLFIRALKGHFSSAYYAPVDLVGLCIFLASAASDFITGETVRVDGGRHLR